MTFKGTLQSMPEIIAAQKTVPPEWARLERLLFDTINEAAMEFAARYTRSDKTLIWRESWPGMDGSDDPYEGFMNFPLFYALGGKEEVYQESRAIWDAITWQWTQYGQIHREFDAYYDWMHHGEGYLFFYFFGLCDPDVLKDRQRAIRFAEMYTGEDPEAQNYDPDKKLIRSPITGSRGPRFHQTAEDWETHREILDHYLPPFEDIPGVDGNGSVCHWSDDAVYSEILKRINERQAKGDVPLNLNATSLVTHAYMNTKDDKYRQWVLEYLDAWKKRTDRNDGIMPDNVGLSDEIGEYNEGKWWGGYYGWRWPHGAFTILEPTINACSNAVVLTGDCSHLDLARSQLDMLWALRRKEGERWVVPNRHYDDGWRDYRFLHPMYAIYLWNISMAEEDAERAERGWEEEILRYPDRGYSNRELKFNIIGCQLGFNVNTAQWFRYIRGDSAEYPVQLLKANYEMIIEQLEKFRSDEFDPHLMDHYKESMSIHQWQDLMPVIIEGLAQLTLGGPMHLYHGGLQHARIRYFDNAARRPGLPESVSALVERLAADSVTFQLVNLSLFEEKEVIVQAGVFGEHTFEEAYVLVEEETVSSLPLNGKLLLIRLLPGTAIKLRISMKRYVNLPSYDFPWSMPEDKTYVIQGRTEYDY